MAKMDAPARQRILEILERIDRPGTFCTSGRLPPIHPGLEVAGVGPILLPLDTRQAAALKKRAHQAPYGKGTHTLVDTDVRRVWEVDADQVTLANPQWSDVLKQALAAVQSALGLETQTLEARLYKLLLYEAGSFFLAHRDGEKLDRMVATLVIALPSAHNGGELVVRHEGRETTVDFSPNSRFQIQFAAFYADCEHEIRQVTSGFRLALVFNLTLEKSKRTIPAPTSREHIAVATSLLRQWRKRGRQTPKAPGTSAASQPLKLAVLLDHQYTEAGLTRDALKGVDSHRADVLFTAAREAGCEASLALVTYWESGSAEPSGEYGYGRGGRRSYGWHSDEAEFDDERAAKHVMGEVYDSSLMAEHFSDADGNPLAFGQIPLSDDEIISKQPLKAGTPDKEDFEGYTGNAGMTLERWYHRAAVLLWAAESRFDVLCEAGVESAVGGLQQTVRQWKHAKTADQETSRRPCLEFARRIIAHWPERRSVSGYCFDDGFDESGDCDQDGSDFAAGDALKALREYAGPGRAAAASKVSPSRCLLTLLENLGDIPLIAAWIRGVLARDVTVDPGEILGNLCKQHGWATFHDELCELLENTSNETLERHARLLADCCLRKDKNADRQRLCLQLAERVLSAVERWDPSKAKRDWKARVVNRSELLPPLAQAFLALHEPALLDRLVTYLIGRPKEFDLTTVHVPALLSLQPWLMRNVKHVCSPLHRWLTAVVEELNVRTSRPPQEPADWRRESVTGCSCSDCEELSRFLTDPNKQVLRLSLAQGRRQHLHQVIDGKKLDTTHVTERRGRPYTLVCTKTKASYERALRAHRVDLDHLQKMRQLLEWHDGLLAGLPRLKNGTATSKKGSK